MKFKVVILLAAMMMSSIANGQSKTSVSIVERADQANYRVFITETALGYGKMIYVAETDPGYGKTFHFTDNVHEADIVFKKPWESPQAASLRLYIHNQNPGYATIFYTPEHPPGYGDAVYFAEEDPGYGKALYVEDIDLIERKNALAIMLYLLGEL